MSDPVNSPEHYRWLPVEVIEITEHLGFCLGNVVKYVLRADHKGAPLEDLRKARWYLDREIARREAEGSSGGMCGKRSTKGYVCTRDSGHAGDHIAEGARDQICDRWPR